MFTKLLLALLLLAASFGYPYALEMSVVYFVGMSTFFYYTVMKVFAGLILTEITKGDLQLPFLSVILNLGGMYMIYNSPYWYLTFYCASFVATTLFAYILSVLLTYEFIEIKPEENE